MDGLRIDGTIYSWLQHHVPDLDDASDSIRQFFKHHEQKGNIKGIWFVQYCGDDNELETTFTDQYDDMYYSIYYLHFDSMLHDLTYKRISRTITPTTKKKGQQKDSTSDAYDRAMKGI